MWRRSEGSDGVKVETSDELRTKGVLEEEKDKDEETRKSPTTTKSVNRVQVTG